MSCAQTALIALPFWLLASCCWPLSARATQGHVFASGIVYQAATYVGHPKYGTHPSYYGNSPDQVIDINIGWGSNDDEGTPLFAPEDGTVRQIHDNTDSWGYSLEWRNSTGSERLFLAHLKTITKTGQVHSGEKIGEIGGTGGWNPHLHIESAGGWVVLSGKEVRPPVNPPDNGKLYVSNGPVSSGSAVSAESSAIPIFAAADASDAVTESPATEPEYHQSRSDGNFVYDLGSIGASVGRVSSGSESLPSAAPKGNALPAGQLEKAGCSIEGWVRDPDATEPAEVLLYVDGILPDNYLAAMRADIVRPDIPQDDKSHGFVYLVPAYLRDGLPHTVYAYGVDSQGGRNPLIGQTELICLPEQTVNQPAAVTPVLDPQTGGTMHGTL